MKKMNESPIFIIGNPRSGTTLLRLILHAHSNIVVPPEAGFALWLYSKYSNFKFSDIDLYLDDMKKTKKIGNWNLNWEDLRLYLNKVKPKNYSKLIDSIYFFYSLSINKCVKRWGDKNNFYLNYIKEIKELFPNAIFIHIVRDGRNVACSYKNLSNKTFSTTDAPDFSDNIIDIAKEWNNNISIINKSFKDINFENIYELKLEDLTLEPKKTVLELMEFIGENFETQLLEYYTIDETNGLEPKSYNEWKAKNRMPIQNEDRYKFRKELTKKEIDSFNSYAMINLLRYNYPLL